ENLIMYAADVGIGIEKKLRQEVLSARLAASSGWTEQSSAKLLSALTTLSERLKPVSGESLRKCAVDREAALTIRLYRQVAIRLAAIIIPYSIAAFVASAACEAIRKDIDTANGLAVTLARELQLPISAAQSSGSPRAGSEAVTLSDKQLSDLQQFAA